MSSLRSIRIAAWSAVFVLVAALGAILVWQPGFLWPGNATVALGGPFSLTDQHGGTVTEAALKGHPSALFFGYTYCPDVCPTTLYDMTEWLKALGPDADKLNFYFVTVDPERDTQDQLASYLGAFDPRITGLTGSRPAIDRMLKAYRIFSRKVPQSDGSYIMDHSASVYLLDRNAAFFGVVDYKDPPEAALAKLKRLLAAG